MDWFKGKFTGKPHISWENLWFPVDFPLNQSIEWFFLWSESQKNVPVLWYQWYQLCYPLVNVFITNWKITMHFSWENSRHFYGHVLCRKLLVITRGYIPLKSPFLLVKSMLNPIKPPFFMVKLPEGKSIDHPTRPNITWMSKAPWSFCQVGFCPTTPEARLKRVHWEWLE